MRSSRETRRASATGCVSAGCRSRAATTTNASPAVGAAVASDGSRTETVGWCSTMIDLLVGNDRRGFGIATALAIEGIPARRITRAAEFDGRVLIVSADRLEGAAATLAGQVPTGVIGGAASTTGVTDEVLTLALDDAIWSAAAQRVGRHADGCLVLPRARACGAASSLDGTVLATFQDAHGRRAPAVVQRGQQVWCL